MAAALAVKGLAKRYRRVQALHGVDLEIAEGELVGLLGPNGAGKSTLVKIACGLVRQSAGTASVCGAPAGSATARAALGYLAEFFRFPGWMSADEVLLLHQRLAGSDGGESERTRLLELVALSDARTRRIEEMSKGMQQRLGIAQALVGRPKILLLDEPTSALDPVGRRTVRELLEEVRSRGVSVLLNSHLLSEVELVCDRVAILLGGRLVAEGTTAELAHPRGVEIETDEGVKLFSGREARRHATARSGAGRGGPQHLRRQRAALDPRGGLSRGRAGGDRLVPMRGMSVIVGYAIGEAVRRKVFLVVLVLTAIFLGLYGLANYYIFRDVGRIRVPADAHVDGRTFAGAFTVGMAMFATLFLGVVLTVFLTLGTVSGDAERGLLQPLVVRPIGRGSLLLARFLAAASVCAIYVVLVYLATITITGLIGDWWPDTLISPGFLLAAAVVVMTALSLLGSVFLSATANGIAIFMLFSAGLVSGLLGTIGHAVGSSTISHWATVAAWALPFEALYQDALGQITSHTAGFTGFLLRLGPFGGAYNGGWGVRGWALAYLVLVGAAAVTAFARRDL